MGAVTQCYNCRKLGPAPPEGWLVLFRVEPVSHSLLSVLSSSPHSGAEMSGTFCGWVCVAEYAAVRALVPESGETP